MVVHMSIRKRKMTLSKKLLFTHPKRLFKYPLMKKVEPHTFLNADSKLIIFPAPLLKWGVGLEGVEHTWLRRLRKEKYGYFDE